MKNPLKFAILPALAAALALASCGGAPKQSRCNVEVFSPEKKYTEVRLMSTDGHVLDSTLVVRNDSILFSRTDSTAMPYVATLRLRNPSDSIDMIFMPIVIEGGTVRLDLTSRISLSGTDDNEKMYQFLKEKNRFSANYENPGHDTGKLREDYSRFFADQAILYGDNIVGEYILRTYGSLMTAEDRKRVDQRTKK